MRDPVAPTLCMRPIYFTTWRRLSSPEAPDEPPTVSEENVLKVECNITSTTNFMLSGIMEVCLPPSPNCSWSQISFSMQALNQPLIKHSPTLGREATYNSRSRLSRLPTYLAIHMVRFTWRRDINKKAKIMVSAIVILSCRAPTRDYSEESEISQ